ncbi:MAG TPA: hypothetical protein VKZ81_27990 [Pseudonocardia sp.]|uniref:hypothetical protein n=1 Tax=Pseudonocardia sp. TaxID=60912 RepID=UPI002B4AB27B|nr:hypothetical protein [Pseudonocardia sp.]HLU59321.1 hypothetical protein [Pseudonocardia sp.]
MLTGLGLLVAGPALLAAVPTAPYAVLATGLLLIGAGVSLTLPALVTVVVAAAPAGTAGTTRTAERPPAGGGDHRGPAFLCAAATSGAAALLWVLDRRHR